MEYDFRLTGLRVGWYKSVRTFISHRKGEEDV